MHRTLIFAFLLPLRLFGVDHYVDSASGNDSNNGLTSGTAWRSFNKPTNSVNVGANDRVLLQGTWSEAFYMPTNGVELLSFGTGATIDGTGVSNRWGVLTTPYSNTWTHGLTIKNVHGATPPNETGALWQNDAGTNTITDCTLDNHVTDDNVAINESGVGIVSNCFILNASDQGVTMHTVGPNTLAIIKNCTISNCLEAFKNSGAPMTIVVSDCTMVNNGHDVDSLDGAVGTFTRCRFLGRSDSTAWSFVKASVTNQTYSYCLFDCSRSSSGQSGPAVTVQAQTTVFNNCVFYGGASGGDIGSMTVSDGATCNMTNCIINRWWRGAFLGTGSVLNMDHCMTNTVSTGSQTVNVNKVAGTPSFVNAGSDFHLNAGSAAIGAGLNLGIALDLDNSAVVNPPSLGVFEFGARLTKQLSGKVQISGKGLL